MKTIIPARDEKNLQDAASRFKKARHAVALTGAGISVNSGIADFRSPGGVWTVFSPAEYATLEVFLHNPEKAWKLYREMGKCLVGKEPNRGHKVLADFEQQGHLKGIVTQNVDNLHQQAGNQNVLEIHGDHQHLQCLKCGNVIPIVNKHWEVDDVPTCELCTYPYKPNVVLFGETVRNLEQIDKLVRGCDLLLVIGTSAQVYPAAGIPSTVKQYGGLVYEFNWEPALADNIYAPPDFFFKGDLSTTLPLFFDAVINS
jgi:NAD-dependent deacetylase